MESGAKSWLSRALQFLQSSLKQPRHEVNELDWKSGLSPDKGRLAEHLSAFGNHAGGGFLVFGISDSGIPAGVKQEEVERVVNQVANLGRQSVEPALAVDHAVAEHEGVSLLVVFVPESPVKPVHLRGKSIDRAFIRSGGTTRRASRQDVGNLMLDSRTPDWEECPTTVLLPDSELLTELDAKTIFQMLDRPVPGDVEQLLQWLQTERFIVRDPSGGGRITNLGGIPAAKKLSDFPDLDRKAVRVIVYEGLDKALTKHEQEGTKGYAISFQGLLGYVLSLLPQSEVIEKALRRTRTLYPEIALREIIANALIHPNSSRS